MKKYDFLYEHNCIKLVESSNGKWTKSAEAEIKVQELELKLKTAINLLSPKKQLIYYHAVDAKLREANDE